MRRTRVSQLVRSLGDEPPVVFALQLEMDDPEVIAYFTIDGEPQSKARPRMSGAGRRPYTPGKTRDAEERIAWLFRSSVGPLVPSSSSSFGVFAAFFCGTRQRRDVDNMIKLILDSLNGVAWKDDMQVTEVSGRLLRGSQDARTEVLIYRTLDQPPPTRPCQQCGGPYPSYPSQENSRRFCSASCGYAWRKDRDLRPCAHCGRGFRAKPSDTDAKHCSMECRWAAGRALHVEISCRICGSMFTLRPSEVEQRPKATCSIACAAQARRKVPSDNTGSAT